MSLLTIINNTVFRKSNKALCKLANEDKFSISAGNKLNIKYAYRAGDSCLVKLEKKLGNLGKLGYFFQKDIDDEINDVWGTWLTNVDSDILHSRSNIELGLQRLKDLGFNTIYPVVWQRGFTLFPSIVAQDFTGFSVMEDPNFFQNRDMLTEIIEVAKPLNLRVIPWFEYGLMAPPNSPLAQNHPDLLHLDSRLDNIRLKSHDKNKLDIQVWLNPCQPKVQEFMVELIADVVERYEIDGIQLDDHFGFPIEMGYDLFTQNLYKTEQKIDILPPNHKDSNWVSWAEKKTTQLLEKIFHAVKSKRSDCLISISPNPQEFSKKYYLANWKLWVEDGLAEEIVLQVYRDNLPAFIGEINKLEVIEAQKHIPVSIGILSGLKNKPIALSLIQSQIQKTRANNYAGVSFFFYETFFNEMVLDSSNQLKITPRDSLLVQDLSKWGVRGAIIPPPQRLVWRRDTWTPRASIPKVSFGRNPSPRKNRLNGDETSIYYSI